jgi:hypothetical protein
MSEELERLGEEENLQDENEFLKMKLMLEKGAFFGGNEDKTLPPELENIFLKGVIETEKIFDAGKTIKIGDKLGRPTHFKQAHAIPDGEIDQAWKELRKYMNSYSVDLDACSPNITSRELYRFTLEELFEHETNDMDLPGWTTHFIYDEFHPDPVYDNTQIATNIIREVLQKEHMSHMYDFREKDLQLNDHYPLQQEEFKNLIDRYKLAYDNLVVDEINDTRCTITENNAEVSGSYHMTATSGKEVFRLGGNWKVELVEDSGSGYWYIKKICIEGINF